MKIFEYIGTFLEDFLMILGEMSPYLLLGFFFAGLLHVYVPKNKIERHLNGGSLKSSIWATLVGIPLPLCSCGVIPTGTALYKNGASKEGSVAFLISTPQTGVDSMLATYSLMGLPLAIIRPLAALITGISGGLLTGAITKEESPKPVTPPRAAAELKGWRKILEALRYGFVEFIQDISKWLLIGLLMAAAISAALPSDFIALLELPPMLQMLLVLIVSIPFYICATGSIPLAAILIAKGLSPGAAFVLLMAGPASNAATMTMIAKVMGKKSLLSYLSAIVIGALGFGILIDYVLPAQWFEGIAQVHMGHEHGTGIAWWQIASGVALMGLILNGYLQKWNVFPGKTTEVLPSASQEQLTLHVEGMSCNKCKANVENCLQDLPYIDSAMVDLASKSVLITGKNIQPDQAKEELEARGYSCSN